MGLGLPLYGQYAGPAILSRGEAPSGMVQPQVSFRPFLEVSGTYSTGLATVAVNETGQLANAASIGTALIWGVSGTHTWRRDQIGLDYRGSVMHYARRTYYDSINQSLLLGYTHQFSRHIKLSLRQAAGSQSRDNGLSGLQATVPFDPTNSYLPKTDFFDNRTTYLSTQGDLIIQKTARLSFLAGGDFFANRRRSAALQGLTAQGARGDAQYRLTRRTTVGANYNYYRYAYTGVAGTTDIHSINGTYAVGITRGLEFSTSAGFVRAESKFIQTTAVDPVVAAILGISSSPQIVHSIFSRPNVMARLARTMRAGVLFVAAANRVVPGNGLFLTSYSTSVSGGYAYTGLRRWSFSAQAMRDSSLSFTTVEGRYGSTSAAATMSRQFWGSMHVVLSYSARKYGSSDFTGYRRTVQEGRFGLGFTPGDIPLRLW